MTRREDHPEATCNGKKRYGTWEHAAYDAKKLRELAPQNERQKNVYRCRQCGGFHVGTNLKKHLR